MNPSLKYLNRSAYQYQLAMQEVFKSICDSIFRIGIRYFFYLKVFNDGSYLMFINNMEYVRAYLESIKSAGETFTGQVNFIKKDESSYSFLPSNLHSFDKKKEPILELISDFNFGNMFFINKGKGENFITIYGFGGGYNDIFFSRFLYKKSRAS